MKRLHKAYRINLPHPTPNKWVGLADLYLTCQNYIGYREVYVFHYSFIPYLLNLSGFQTFRWQRNISMIPKMHKYV